jgi:hypothetical protein
MYTSFQTDVWNLYGHICTLVVRLLCGVCIVNSELNNQNIVWSLYGDICSQGIRLMCVVFMETSVHKKTD